MHVTKSHNNVDIRFMALGREGITQENNQIDLVVFNLGADLLHPSEMACQKLMDREVGHLFNQPACCTGGADIIFGEYPPVCNAEVLHQLFLRIMCYQGNFHLSTSEKNKYQSKRDETKAPSLLMVSVFQT